MSGVQYEKQKGREKNEKAAQFPVLSSQILAAINNTNTHPCSSSMRTHTHTHTHTHAYTEKKSTTRRKCLFCLIFSCIWRNHFHFDVTNFVLFTHLLPVSIPEARITRGHRATSSRPAWATLNPTWLAGFQQANLIFLNTGLCFSFITAGARRRVAGLGGKAELIGLPEKPVDLNMKGGIIIIIKKKNTCMCSLRWWPNGKTWI